MLKVEDPYSSMEKDQLISMIHFLVKRKGYFPKAEESKTIDRIPGTHASCSLLANLVFNVSSQFLPYCA